MSLIPSFQACSIAYFGVSARAGVASVVSSTLAGAIAYFGVSAGAASEISSTLAGVSVVSSFY